MDVFLEELLALLPAELSEQDPQQLLRRLEILEVFADADGLADRAEAAIAQLQARRAAGQRLGFNPGRPAVAVPEDRREARRWARLERRLQRRLREPPAPDAGTRQAAAAWLASVDGGRALGTPASRRYWQEVCEHKIRLAPAGKPMAFWHACRQLVMAAARAIGQKAAA